MELDLCNLQISPADERAAEASRARWDAIAKPLGSLGRLEDAVTKIAALTGDPNVDLNRRCVVTYCSDNGVVARGVAQSDPTVTGIIARMMADGSSSVCRMGAQVNVDCIPVDVGMFSPVDDPRIVSRRIAAGTADLYNGPAMTREQALCGIRVGIDMVGELAARGYDIIGTGEMGIGNTTTATAMACVFLGKEPALLVGRGAGLSDEGLTRKTQVIEHALAVNAPDANNALDVLAKLGGFDIAALCGTFLGGAIHRVPIVVDGVISTVAAYCAWRLCPDCLCALLPSHLSAEPAAAELLRRMDLVPPIAADMRLGEGTGAVCLMALLDVALALYHTGVTYKDLGLVVGEGPCV